MASKKEVYTELKRVNNVCPIKEGADIQATFEEYHKFLHWFALHNLRAAIDEYISKEKWFPRIAELVELATKYENRADCPLMVELLKLQRAVAAGVFNPALWFALQEQCNKHRRAYFEKEF